MKKVPSSVVILGRKVKVKQGNNLHYMGEPCLGLCDYDNKIIYLEKNQSPQMKHDTLIHEMTHFFLELTGLSQKLSDSENEIYCQLITAFHNDLKHSL
jgi:Zn-dependent peptidase ImmA (M78 family)